MDNEAVNNLIMQGVVAEVSGSRARVKFEDRDNMLSAPLQVLQLFTGANKTKHMPSLGEKVVCLFLPTGLEDGYIIGSVYINGDDEPENNETIYEDGSSISVLDGVLNIVMRNGVNITTPTLTVNGNMATTGISQTEGSLSVTGLIHSDIDVTAGGVSLKGHTNGGKGVDQ